MNEIILLLAGFVLSLIMLNIYDTIKSGLYYNKFEVGKLLFVEYTCPIEDEELGVWTHCDYLLHVLSGKKGWRTVNHTWQAEAGQTYYVKKSAYIIKQFFEEDFCMLLFFLPDDFIRDAVKKAGFVSKKRKEEGVENSPVIEVKNDIMLSAYFQSMLTYFTKRQKPSDSLLTMKLSELIFNILQSPSNPKLSGYLQSLQHDPKPSLIQTMNENFCYNLSLQEYARLSGRSLATFKREFKKYFNISPGWWLRKKRVEYAANLLNNTDLNISQICQESGFKNLTHFSRIFKEELQITPSDFRKQIFTA